MASFMRGASARPPGEALAELEGRGGRRQSRLFPLASEPSQTGPEGRGDLPSPPGNQQRALGQAERVSAPSGLPAPTRRPRGLLFPAFRLHTFTGNPADDGPPCKSQASLSGDKSLLVGVGIPWHQAVLWAQGLFHSSVPILRSHILRASGSLARVWRGGEWEEDTAPEAQRVLSWVSQPSSSGWEPPGPTINISSVGGARPPALS